MRRTPSTTDDTPSTAPAAEDAVVQEEHFKGLEPDVMILVDVQVNAIGLHVRKIFIENELVKTATTEEFSVVQRDGNLCKKCTGCC